MKFKHQNKQSPFYNQIKHFRHACSFKKRSKHTETKKKRKYFSKSSSSSSPSYSSTSHSSESLSSCSTSKSISNHYDFKVGERLGHYKIKKLLGDGTFGRVVLGKYHHKKYAIKIIRPVSRYIESAKTERKIIKEINKRDKHDNQGIVRYVHSFEHKNHYCMVFKPLGKSLYDIIKMNRYKGFPMSMVQSFLKQIFSSLSFLHKIGYTHTDLKPENILLQGEQLQRIPTQDGDMYLPKRTQIKIIDFGGATKYNDYHSSTICTRQYRPPEVILQCCKWNQLADVWSIGCIGQLLFPTHSDQEHLVLIEKNSGRFPYWMIKKTPSSLKQLFINGSFNWNQIDRKIDSWNAINNMKTSAEILKGFPQLSDLIQQCLQIDPNRRINCYTALQHPFFKIVNY